jgi:hypothetical protein
MTFTVKEQKEHRPSFINKCRQKTGSVACHADFIGKRLDEPVAVYTKLKEPTRNSQKKSRRSKTRSTATAKTTARANATKPEALVAWKRTRTTISGLGH